VSVNPVSRVALQHLLKQPPIDGSNFEQLATGFKEVQH
jgi:hypothetical protein